MMMVVIRRHIRTSCENSYLALMSYSSGLVAIALYSLDPKLFEFRKCI